ncbi:hypothetical protein VCHA54O485_150086 [Vibrio chagasii]|nr:hypothetical protein VCHA55P509_140086 [Vibrio chagasii]CAH6990217.1 hypothetical protein VCHA54O485_150086 [Vibrio chagasii]CAH7227102.1 hypothetical protein VCHA54P501_160032 [Vibrio chagasii]
MRVSAKYWKVRLTTSQFNLLLLFEKLILTYNQTEPSNAKPSLRLVGHNLALSRLAPVFSH